MTKGYLTLNDIYKWLEDFEAKEMSDNNKMKCYVCYESAPYELGPPAKVFWYRKDAEAWKAENDDGRDYEEMEIE